MKRLHLIAALTVSALMSACSIVPKSLGGTATYFEPETTAAPHANVARSPDLPEERIQIQDADGSAVVQKVAFRSGVSSATVERLAKSYGCTGRTGAALLTAKGPVEVYRLQCDSGATFMAQCELRQCRRMR
ncbi:MAG TPA: hypothetical protein VJ698_08685 [Noviherbaspirillum sp.]|uniref:hypothetical protein n=1 Tax=Noviherbaspirillum sp. TaxID=1926288 RepID=UPI002B488B92|nr:hypothetical protein [Noviherbaspirillum sp.]HJV85542.1 hypothetical protein [Noviherbaspirillum sp.]